MSAKSTDAIPLTVFTSPINLIDYTKGQEIDRLVIVSVSGAATITGKTAGSGSTARTVPVLAGDQVNVQFRTIDSVVGVTAIRLEFGLT